MINENRDSVQLLNTAVIKTKEKRINTSYEERLAEVCQTPVMKALSVAIVSLSESQKISRDQAAVLIVEAVRDLDQIWNDYILMEGMNKLKELLKGQNLPQ